ncbi:MAG: transglutaminase family protein [Verrucomicrobiae bacterium]
MPIHVALYHASRYTYDRPVALAPQVIRLRPAPHCRTPVLSYSLKITPKNHFLNWQQDPFGNYLARIVFPEKTDCFTVETDLIAEMAVYNPFDFFLEESVEDFPFSYQPAERKSLEPFLELAPQGALFAGLIDGVDRSRRRTIGFLVALNARLAQEVRYVVRLEPGVQTPEETLAIGSGSCRDTAWLLVQILRHLGLAARFASGYLIQLAADVKALEGPAGVAEDFTDLHAWCEVYLPGAGWVGLDPTSGLFAGEGHLPLACTPEPASAAPISGAMEDCESSFAHEMRVGRVVETPRVTKPYTPEQWEEIDALGQSIDERLRADDVRLTMGGEPTFISIDNRDGDEWSFAAVGPDKRRLSDELLRRMHGRFAPGGLLHFGQGKWYPGESLPRWAYGCFWRKDGVPIWRDETLFAKEGESYGHTERDAERFIRRLAHLLDIGREHIRSAYEDVWHHLLRERELPVNVDPLESRLANAEERERLAKIFDQGLDKIVGYALPLRRKEGKWESGLMFLRREHCFLIPGDSPMGLRLPLDSLPWAAPADVPSMAPPDPFAERLPLSEEDASWRRDLRERAAQAERASSACGGKGAADGTRKPQARREPRPQESAASIVRTTLCVEPRDGKLHVFLPPVDTTEASLRLIAAVEETARSLRLPVVVEGEPPARDPRLNQIKITPDPGVIEVNIHPAASWDDLVAQTTTVYAEARLARLGTEKFLMDGRHTGTGGGNHIVIGGATPADSPLLRRPDLLRSLLCYWQNHPSLSFLFSGLFIGPTSQHPRVDEARNDSLHELEIAFDQIPDRGEVPPWLVDRIFRHLLTDAAGNTHRTEFCIDKLYDPASSSGRLGLLEMRAFEMPPHAQMSLTQALLLRALISRFWNEPYRQPLVRWGTQLHDRFMLPHFVEEDFRDVIGGLRHAGYPMRPEWFAPHLEFRFPKHGEISLRGIHVELRQALEPWHVLGEEGAGGGTVRYVDSSLERLQVKVRGLVGSRHSLACNGWRVPLHPAGAEGEHVAGIRFRAWQPPECLHPTIKPHSPLVFDLVDLWNERSIGGCTYSVSHPGGLSYETLPVNAFEAESRRFSRFAPFGGRSPGPAPAPKESTIRDFPFTLDLRAQR